MRKSRRARDISAPIRGSSQGLKFDYHTKLTRIAKDTSRRTAFVHGMMAGDVYERDREILWVCDGSKILARFDALTLPRLDEPDLLRRLDARLRLHWRRDRQVALLVTLLGMPIMVALGGSAAHRYRRRRAEPSVRLARAVACYCLFAFHSFLLLGALRFADL